MVSPGPRRCDAGQGWRQEGYIPAAWTRLKAQNHSISAMEKLPKVLHYRIPKPQIKPNDGTVHPFSWMVAPRYGSNRRQYCAQGYDGPARSGFLQDDRGARMSQAAPTCGGAGSEHCRPGPHPHGVRQAGMGPLRSGAWSWAQRTLCPSTRACICLVGHRPIPMETAARPGTPGRGTAGRGTAGRIGSGGAGTDSPGPSARAGQSLW